jgi:hypothetical protein
MLEVTQPNQQRVLRSFGTELTAQDERGEVRLGEGADMRGEKRRGGELT